MNCPDCGHDLPDPWAACPSCGHRASPWARQEDIPAAPASTATGGGYGDPRQYLDTHPGAMVESYPAVAAPQKKPRRLVAVLTGALVILLIGSGVAVAGGLLGWYGAGKRPSDLLPGSAIGYAQLDLDPSLAQKTAAWQFLRDLPEVKDALAAGLPDPKGLLWKLLVTSDPDFKDVDYETGVKPWLGNRFGSVLLNRDGKAVAAAAIELANVELGATTLRDWAERFDTDYEVTVRDGYALVTDPDETEYVLAELARGTLAANPTFAADFAAMGEPGISAGWTDLGALARLSGPDIGTAVGVSQGRVAYAVRFSAETLEVAGITRGFTGPVAIPEGDLGNLPADTGLAVSLTGGGAALAKAWPELPKEAKDSVADLGLSLPDDLVALLGNSFQVAASADTIRNAASLPETVEIGLRVSSADAARAEQVLLAVASGATPAGEDLTRVDGSILVAGTTAAYRDRIAGEGPRLAGSEWFAKAVPDHATATFAAWVDLTAVVSADSTAAPKYQEFRSALRGFGSQFVPAEAGTGSWSVRIVRA